MSAHTPGPLSVRQTGIGFPYVVAHKGEHETIIAQTYVQQPEPQTPMANAALLAASYTLLDRTARELGVDATELATKLDLTYLICLSLNVASATRHKGKGDEAALYAELADYLRGLPLPGNR